jgi:hypothetical protein
VARKATTVWPYVPLSRRSLFISQEAASGALIEIRQAEG